MKKYLGIIIDDMEVVGYLGIKGTHRYFHVKCTKCGRTKIINAYYLLYPKSRKGTKHSSCGRGTHKKDKHFYCIWANMRDRTTRKK